jgi:hypothetical protein
VSLFYHSWWENVSNGGDSEDREEIKYQGNLPWPPLLDLTCLYWNPRDFFVSIGSLKYSKIPQLNFPSSFFTKFEWRTPSFLSKDIIWTDSMNGHGWRGFPFLFQTRNWNPHKWSVS